MPVVNGRTQYWWNFSAKDPKTGRQRTFFLNGFGNIATREQLFAYVKAHFPYIDIRDFSCELTDTPPQNKRDLVPRDYYMTPWVQWAVRQLTGEKPDPDAGKIVRPRSILHHGPSLPQPQERGAVPQRDHVLRVSDVPRRRILRDR